MGSRLTAMTNRRTLRRWSRYAAKADALDATGLKALRTEARALGREVDRVLHIAEGRLALPLAGRAEIPRPLHTDWAWRPEIWSGPIRPAGWAGVETKTPIGAEARIFHDCTRSELTLRQVRNTRADDVAAYGLRMDVFRFDGSFLSLVVDLPPEAATDLGARHIFRLDIRVETEAPLEIFGRLNVRHGPNVAQVIREFDGSSGERMVEFDLALSRIDEDRLDRLWLDLIFEGPEMNQITLRDLTLTRRPRAEV